MTEPVIFERDFLWFYRCPECPSTFEGAYWTWTLAKVALEQHRDRRHP